MFGATARRIPTATYRLQLRQEFPLAAATALVPYAHALGISDFYTSPVFLSTPGSSHGYDVNDYRRIDPELGGRAALDELHAALSAHGLGLLLDFVPNHMGINGPGLLNVWWRDVLENGEYSRYAGFFDIDWDAGTGDGPGQVMVPILEDHYGRVLEQGKLSLVYEAPLLCVAVGDMRFPVSPSTYAAVLEPAATMAPSPELAVAVQAFAGLPKAEAQADGETARQRATALADLKRELAHLLEREPKARRAFERRLQDINGRVDQPASFDELDRLICRQHYRLAYWKAAVHEVNYRRFFAIDTLIGVRMEIPEVFAETHALLGKLLEAGVVTGLRIDHVDGLRQPQQYLARLQSLASRAGPKGALYVVVEKILAEQETLPAEWECHGTTGYEFIADLAGLLVDASAERLFTRTYEDFVGESIGYDRAVYEKKRLVLDEMFANAVVRLAVQLADLVQTDRAWRDITRHELTVAVREVMAGHGVYRTYRRGLDPMEPRDQRVVEQACALAIARNPRIGRDTFELVRDVLTGAHPGERGPERLRRRLASWVLTFQQYTGAVMAKAVEDTLFYTYSRFIALNEVGGNPGRFGGTVAGFHAANAERLRRTPHGLLATSTHDTKLGEDARARLYALAEIPHEWREGVLEWRELNRAHKTSIGGRSAPDADEEYRLYQVLVATWPPDGAGDEAYRARLREYLRKAMNEARRNTSWIQPNAPWLEAADRFVEGILGAETGREFLASFRPRAERVAHLGMVNALTQVVLKITSPGVPDFYQGSEWWNFSLVDPDNRRPVDYAAREQLAAEGASPRPWCELLRNWRDGAVKWHVTRTLLQFRAAHPTLFQEGEYRPLEIHGRLADHVVAFARVRPDEISVTVVPRLTSRLGSPPLRLVWDDTVVILPPPGSRWCDVATGEVHAGTEFLVADLFLDLPFAVLHGTRA